jgi:hypothetical protein
VSLFDKLRRFTDPAIILLAAAVATAPLLVHGPSCGHDFDFHLGSWLDCLNSWRHGLFYPHWAPSANYGAGEPRFVFYPPLTWMLGAALGAVVPWAAVPAALTFLLLAATGLATRALALQALDDAPATLAGCAALFSGYTLFTAYERSAFGELAGGFLIPLLLLYALRRRNPPGGVWQQALDGSTLPLALVIAGAWLSNAPLGVMACYLLAGVALTAAFLVRSWAPVLRATIAASLGLGLASFYLIPADWEQRWVDIHQVTEDAGEKIENSWLFARHADPALQLHDVELRRVSLLAATMLAVALLGLLIAWKRGKLPADRRCWIPLAVIPAAILLLQLPISLPVWNLLPKLRFLQFPWRWLVVLEAPMGIFFAAGVWFAGRWRRLAIVAVCAVLFLSATLAAGRFFYQACYEEDAVPGMLNVYRSGAGFAGTDEYAPPYADNSLAATSLPVACLVTDPAATLGALPGPESEDDPTIPTWDPAQKSCQATFPAAPESSRNRSESLRVAAFAAHPGYLILRRRSYPAWRVTVNGSAVTLLPQREDGLMAVPVPQGPVDLTVDWTTTPDVVIGRWLSGLALILLAALYFTERKLGQIRFSSRPRLS